MRFRRRKAVGISMDLATKRAIMAETVADVRLCDGWSIRITPPRPDDGPCDVRIAIRYPAVDHRDGEIHTFTSTRTAVIHDNGPTTREEMEGDTLRVVMEDVMFIHAHEAAEFFHYRGVRPFAPEHERTGPESFYSMLPTLRPRADWTP